MKFYSDKQEYIDTTLWYSLKRVMSFACQEMYLTGGRRRGKTFSVKTYCISDFMDNGNKFAWVRTSEAALKNVNNDEQFFGRQSNLLDLGVKTHKIKNNVIYINDKIAGYMFAVSTFHNVKGADYNCKTIVWDEFIKCEGERPISNKRKKFFDLVESIGRGDVSRVICMSNAINQYDEVFAPFKVKLDKFGCYVYREKNAVIHYIAPSKLHTEMIEKGLSFQGMSEKEREISFGNKFINYGDYGDLSKARYIFSIQTDDDKFLSVYIAKDKLYIKTTLPNNPFLCCFNSRFVNGRVKRINIAQKKMITNAYNNGSIVFTDGYAREALREYIA